MKTAIVTGGTKGIGKSIVVELLKQDYFVWTNYANDDKAAEDASKDFQKISSHYKIIKADQSQKKSFYQFIKEIRENSKAINCIIGNTGLTVRKKNFEITDDDWEKVMFATVNSHFYLIRDLHTLIENNSRIVFIGSMLGILPHATSLPYGVSKAALHALGKNLVKEFEGTGTTVNIIAPGFVETEWQKNKPLEIRNNIYQKTAIKRFATPKEVADTVMFCINNSYINGSVLEINGGYSFK
ncbi:MAG: SDR family oxidoreductase [Candidatus Paraprevotella stercoravium]|jgi:3-oxoacyl-[acyl-carrier protein] reductase|uniref:SDR family oxidoreductase n=2 Tax=Bacteroidales TaxID=171549 RepID=A0ABT7U386_9BACE|nr:SDR family oxidoreductase [Candidatus Paraprevotella stercoravium]MDM8144940.1 SDR family oxidoreductase [Bacteroides eggerthii]